METPGLKKFRNVWVVNVSNTGVVEVRSKWIVKGQKQLGCKGLEEAGLSKFRIGYIFGFSKFTTDFVTVGCSWVVKG